MQIAVSYPTYKAYCAVRAAQGYQVIPERLWNALKEAENEQGN
jgi:hypothetical protein